MIYAASDDESLYVLSPEGEEMGRFDGEGWLSYPVIGEDGTVYVSDAENMLWAVSSEACEGAEFDLHRMVDINGDGVVNLADFACFAEVWQGCTDERWPEWCDGDGEPFYFGGDVNRDLYVMLDDVVILAVEWLSGE